MLRFSPQEPTRHASIRKIHYLSPGLTKAGACLVGPRFFTLAAEEKNQQVNRTALMSVVQKPNDPLRNGLSGS